MWTTQTDETFVPQTKDSAKTRFEVEFCALPGLGDISGAVNTVIGILPDSIRFQLTRIRLEQDSSGPGCINLFGVADRYRYTLWFAGSPEKEEKGTWGVSGAVSAAGTAYGMIDEQEMGEQDQQGQVAGETGIGLIIGLLPLLAIVGVIAALAFVLGGITYAMIRDGIAGAFGFLLLGAGALILVSKVGGAARTKWRGKKRA